MGAARPGSPRVRQTLLVALLIIALAVTAGPGSALGHKTRDAQRLSRIGPAPEFTLTNQDGQQLALADLRGKVVAVTFIYASCADTCSLLTAKLAGLQSRLGRDFGPKARFVSITVDPAKDTPDVLRRYALAHRADLRGWSFLTGPVVVIKDVARRYGVVARTTSRGDVDHTFLTSLIDQGGTLRVQYVGVQFDPNEMLRDLTGLVQEVDSR